MLPTFSQNLTLQEAFQTVAQINEELKRREFDSAFYKTFKLLVDRFSSFFAKRGKSVEKGDAYKVVGTHEHCKSLKFWTFSLSFGNSSIQSLRQDLLFVTQMQPSDLHNVFMQIPGDFFVAVVVAGVVQFIRFGEILIGELL